jgi:peptide/nickel transport system substrate-binding protein
VFWLRVLHFGDRYRRRQRTSGQVIRLLVLVLFCGLLLMGCSRGRHQATSPVDQQRIVLGTTAKARTLDPADAYDYFAGTLLYNLGDRLYNYESGTNTLKPQLAKALPQISADGLTYTIPLRSGVVFHDGTPFDAAAMVFSLERFIENGGQPASLLSGRVKSIRALSPDQIEIQLKKPFVAFPSLLAFSGLCAVSPQAYEKGAGKFKPSTFVGTGPYKLTQYSTDSLRLEPFEGYWGDRPKNKGVNIQIFSSSANLYNAFRTGDIDVASQSLDPNQIRALVKKSKEGAWQAIAGSGNSITVLTLNLKQPPWDQLPARQALAAMLNRGLLQDRVFQGQASPLFSLIPGIFPASQPVFKTAYGDGDPGTAKQWLEKAGFSAANPLVLDLWYRSNIRTDALAAIVIKAAITRDMGDLARVELNGVESATAYENLNKGAYPTIMLDWSGDLYDPDSYIEPFLACDEGSQAKGCESGSSYEWGSFFYSDRANQLIDQARRELNPVQRQQTFAQLQEILVQQVPFIPLWQGKNYAFAQKGLQGIELEPTQQFAFGKISKS